MHSATIKYFKTLELIYFQMKTPKRGKAKAKEGRMLPPPSLKETLLGVYETSHNSRQYGMLVFSTV